MATPKDPLTSDADWRAHPASQELIAIAIGAAARVAVRYGLSALAAAELMAGAWYVVQDLPARGVVVGYKGDGSDERQDGENADVPRV